MVTFSDEECVVGLKTLGVSVLNDGKSILAISEGHDEILRFDTCSGHVANRIFPGENRHLDCLLVSENGEVCVCGDAVQKPYPLYAWNVETGVLLRHFANPHHEFLVRLSKLNDDGRLLLATAKELLDSTPTFLVVYDTTTGSTVWQVRPESTSQPSLCASKLTERSSQPKGGLYALNIHTGEERFVITSTSNRIDRIQTAMNKTFLTWDSSSQCRCLRVWDMVTEYLIDKKFSSTLIKVCSVNAMPHKHVKYEIYAKIALTQEALSRLSLLITTSTTVFFSGDGSSIALLLCDKEEPALLSLKGTEHVQEVLQE
ncbi:uncharacterized protein CEXT_198841 [Caerostris extrusa]|uniref:Uncharacterized protein n=1 Tax=Caerostris extrusa TaxID=172846 RepID=A0AAV4WLG3_CAEEX|nr:uncharacterized protein CEXT_198841 [Caerostris extrusa]